MTDQPMTAERVAQIEAQVWNTAGRQATYYLDDLIAEVRRLQARVAELERAIYAGPVTGPMLVESLRRRAEKAEAEVERLYGDLAVDEEDDDEPENEAFSDE